MKDPSDRTREIYADLVRKFPFARAVEKLFSKEDLEDYVRSLSVESNGEWLKLANEIGQALEEVEVMKDQMAFRAYDRGKVNELDRIGWILEMLGFVAEVPEADYVGVPRELPSGMGRFTDLILMFSGSTFEKDIAKDMDGFQRSQFRQLLLLKAWLWKDGHYEEAWNWAKEHAKEYPGFCNRLYAAIQAADMLVMED